MSSEHDDPEKSKDLSLETLHRLIEQRDSVFKRFPLLFTLLGTFGVVTVFYGAQRIMEKIPLVANNPYIALIVGVIILLLTGTLYKKLG